jgi:hypothetical protein
VSRGKKKFSEDERSGKFFESITVKESDLRTQNCGKFKSFLLFIFFFCQMAI